ncbi:hypothetical protein BHM03_00029472 [Ensete ventricosum]|nr:hypothetical protein BHM03_00029472 [Ensete ventricosum]
MTRFCPSVQVCPCWLEWERYSAEVGGARSGAWLGLAPSVRGFALGGVWPRGLPRSSSAASVSDDAVCCVLPSSSSSSSVGRPLLRQVGRRCGALLDIWRVIGLAHYQSYHFPLGKLFPRFLEEGYEKDVPCCRVTGIGGNCLTGQATGFSRNYLAGRVTGLGGNCLTGRATGLGGNYLTGRATGLDKICLISRVTGLGENCLTGRVIGLGKDCLTGRVAGLGKNCLTSQATENPEASTSGTSSGIPSPVRAKALRDLEVMKACHDFDSAVTDGSLAAIWERYSIPEEYALHAPLLEQRPYNPGSPGLSILVDALEAGLRFPLHPIIEECLG